MSSRIRLGVVGAGAVAELCHLPAVAHCEEIGGVTLVDSDPARAAAVAARFGIADVLTDYRQLVGRVDAAIVGVPNYLHESVAIELLSAGVPVLVEKPLAIDRRGAEAMVAAAAATGVPLQVGLMYRFCDRARLLKRVFDQGWLGRLESFSLEWGSVFEWPAATGSFYNRRHAGGGVLLDMGSHALDLLTWWLGPAELTGYSDDSLGGVEADCSVTLKLRYRDRPVPGRVILSRVRNLDNHIRVVGERFTIEYDVARRTSPALRPGEQGDTGPPFVATAADEERQSMRDIYAAQLRSFARTVVSGERPAVSGEDSVPVLDLIERCYREGSHCARPWAHPHPEHMLVQPA
jgi:predicted dehydrogenase